MRKLVAALACRNQGSRLYGKPLQNLDIENNISVLKHIIECIKTEKDIEQIVLGISEGDDNHVYMKFAKDNNLDFIVGDEIDVLSRLIQCGEKAEATDIFRITTESPFTYFEVISHAWSQHTNGDFDATFIENVPDGSGFEILKLEALKYSHHNGNSRHRSELCTLFLRENKEKFNINIFKIDEELLRKDIRLTIDYPEDLILCRQIYSHFKELAPRIPLDKIIKYLDEKPELKYLVAKYLDESIKTMYL